ncbi:uncharacterized protein K460DRAFT_342267 [Cucurbitaria berberidis CBS 394.84]|uniref:Uncharacterized protein n=1 Tax=Cucurbitaria berberidis CBS 394.84 TaxID=1168544 RepID=A0A9P4L6X2_9PLEO|nr:uncharacterized protein K460DRAFT_342267 [Cucurbitaria berberidis CBS 394.84]KAF1843757.1 hypothetical protein K460DRAFT_342267 [Cucurbitaria berberidis CBS 394.84]
MSSGNPFRASQLYSQPASSPIPQASFIKPDNSVPEARGRESDYVLEDAVPPPPKTKKQVRIVSSTTLIPPHPDANDVHETSSDPSLQQLRQSQYAGSSPPVASAGFSSTAALARVPNAQDAGERYDMAAPDVFQPSSRAYSDKQQNTLPPSTAPSNPFAKTLASLEPSKKGSGEDRTSTERPTLGNNRASLDVESFKNLLMTGKPTPRPSVQPHTSTIAPAALSGSQFESSSSTDTSSISRQSLFEPPHEVHAESPRTSYEMAESDEDEHMGLVSEVKKGKKKPPPAPKHRHGKLVTLRQPQIVSFDSFAATEPTPSPVIKSKDGSDVNKPLPPTPVVSPPALHISNQTTTPYQPSPIQPRSNEPLAPSEVATLHKRAPPPVPLSRRQSQLRSSRVADKSRSNSSLTMSSQHSIDSLSSPVPTNQDPIAGAKSPPPPPPPRHGARLTNLGTSSANSSSTELPQRSSSIRTVASAQGPTSSRRSTIDSDFEPSSPVSGVNRTSSMSSNRNTSRAVSNESAGSIMPPPPPPPRRRQSTRSSLDQQRPYIPSSSPTDSRRASTENRRTSLDSKRRTSVASESSLRREYAPADEKGGNEYALYSPKEESENRLEVGAKVSESRSDSSNILDDMERFQREIEELRQRFKQAG